MKIPREIDELMWSVAEADNANATAEFGERYPDMRVEMTKRLKMVRDLKGSRPKARHERFVPVSNIRRFGPSKLAVAGITTLVLFSLGFATYAVVQITQKPTIPQKAAPVTQGFDGFAEPGTSAPDDVLGTLDASADRNAASNAARPGQVIDSFQNPVTISESRILLTDAITAVAVQAGIKITIGPGFEDVYIWIHYVDASAKVVLDDMGREFGFTAMQQNGNSALIIPAVDPLASAALPSGAGSTYVVPGEVVPTMPDEPGAEADPTDTDTTSSGLIIITPSKTDDDDGDGDGDGTRL